MRKIKPSKLNKFWDPRSDTAWPLELVWLRPLEDEKCFEIIGPLKTVTIKTKEKSKWYQAILENN